MVSIPLEPQQILVLEKLRGSILGDEVFGVDTEGGHAQECIQSGQLISIPIS